MSVDVEQLYKSFGVLADAKDNAKEHPEAYKTILKGVEGTSAAKRLSAQFTSRFFKHFPDLSESAINALLDLCEDDDPSIRKAAIKELPNLCKGSKEHVSRLSDVLVQLLVSEETSEVSAVNSALNGLFTLDSKGTLTGVLSQILSGDDEVREKAITYLCTRLKSCSEADMSKETEEYVLEQLKKVLEDVTGGEFQKLMQALSGLHHLQTIQGRQQLVNIIADQLKLDQDFDPKDTDSLNRISQCISMALPLCSRNVHSSPFVNYMCQKVLPQLSLIGCSEAVNGDAKPEVNQPDLRLEILKELSDLCAHCGATEIQDSIQPLFQSLVDFMPLPPTDENEEGSTAPKPKLDFSYVECLMHSFHQLGRHNNEFFTSEEAAAKLKDFRIRLQYFARGVQVYIKELKTSLAGKSPTELRTEKENQIKLVALKTCNNINTLIRDLFHNPPAYKASINVSWKKTTAAPKASPAKAQKRPSTGGNDNDDKKKERTLYRTPGGKYSSNISPGRGGYSNKRGGRKWGGGRGQYY